MSCIICGCDRKISNFRFPKYAGDIRDKWKEFCKNNGVTNFNQSSRICRRHFTADSFKRDPEVGKPYLNSDAVPTIVVEKCVRKSRKQKPHSLQGSPARPVPLPIRNTHSCLICGKNSSEKMSYFGFPKSPTRRQAWVDFCKSYNRTVKPLSRLCKKHFVPDDFKNGPNTSQPQLKEWAIPSLNVENVPPKISSNTHSCLLCPRSRNRLTQATQATQAEKLSYFNFPKNPTYCDEWTQFCKSLGFTPKHNSRLCSKHFDTSDFKTSQRCSLNSTAIPSLFNEQFTDMEVEGFSPLNNEILPQYENNQVDASPSNNKLPSQCDNNIVHEHPPLNTPTENCELVSPNGTSQSNMPPPFQFLATPSPRSSDSARRLCYSTTPVMNNPKRKKSLRYLKDFTEADLVTPRRTSKFFTLASQQVAQYRIKNKSLMRRLNRAHKKIKNLTELVSHLRRELLSKESADHIMGSMPPVLQTLALRSKKARRAKYESDLRKFALTLNFYSPRAYIYARKVFKKILPDPRTLQKWYATVGLTAGLSIETMEMLKKKSVDKTIVCNLVIDEMAIKKGILFDRQGVCHGFINFGSDYTNNRDDQPMAKYAWVFLLVALNDAWKVPCAYFLIDTLTGLQRRKLVDQCLDMLHQNNVNVHSMTFDGASTNISMCHEANFIVDDPDFSPWIKHPTTGERIFIFYDPCHMIKNVRNAFGQTTKKGPFRTLSGEEIKWDFVETLCNLQEETGLHFANKITKRHIRYSENPMSVKLAAQTLSASISDALLYLENKTGANDEKLFPDFENSSSTSEFCLEFNNMFDILNTRSIYDKSPSSRVVSEKTKANILRDANAAEEYIKSLSTNDGKSLTEFSCKCGFIGIIICLRNLVSLYDVLHEKYGLKYLISYKLLQDHIESFFSAVRSRGGFSNNPTALQFHSAYKRLLIHQEILNSEASNCTSLDDIPILCVSSKDTLKTDEDVTNEDLVEEIVDCSQIDISEAVKDICDYIAGFLVKGLLEKKPNHKMYCEEYEIYLTDRELKSDLIAQKNRGGLISPSKDVTLICKVTESLLRENDGRLFSEACRNTIKTSARKSIHDEVFLNIHDNDHKSRLIKYFVDNYVRIRMHHEAKKISEVDKNIRRIHTKLITHSFQ